MILGLHGSLSLEQLYAESAKIMNQKFSNDRDTCVVKISAAVSPMFHVPDLHPRLCWAEDTHTPGQQPKPLRHVHRDSGTREKSCVEDDRLCCNCYF